MRTDGRLRNNSIYYCMLCSTCTVNGRFRSAVRDIALLTGAVNTCETSVIYYQTKRCNIPEDSHLQSVVHWKYRRNKRARRIVNKQKSFLILGRHWNTRHAFLLISSKVKLSVRLIARHATDVWRGGCIAPRVLNVDTRRKWK
jgi:hypothetical protein